MTTTGTGAAAAYDPPVQPAEKTVKVLIGETLATAERRIVLATLEHCNGNKTLCARTLGIDRKTLHRKLALYA